jgi:hypothetical protein
MSSASYDLSIIAAKSLRMIENVIVVPSERQ